MSALSLSLFIRFRTVLDVFSGSMLWYVSFFPKTCVESDDLSSIQASAEMKCNFAKGRRELVLHMYQACVLYLFNLKDTYSYQEIKQITGLPEEVSKSAFFVSGSESPIHKHICYRSFLATSCL